MKWSGNGLRHDFLLHLNLFGPTLYIGSKHSPKKMKNQDEKWICRKGEDKHTKVENVFARDDTKPNGKNNESMEKRFKEKHFFVVCCLKLLP